MKIFRATYIIFISAIVLSSCISSKTNKSGASLSADEMEKTEMEMLEKGYQKGVILSTDMEGNCAFIIEYKDQSGLTYDALNLEDDYKIDGQKIWFKFVALRMMNRCGPANPISISDIQQRLE